jgi:NAD(P)H dehydrogenase (quinone)
MASGLVIYYSRSGNTKKMAETIAEAMSSAQLPTKCKSVDEVKVNDLLPVDAIVVGSPTYYGRMAAPIAQLFDDSTIRSASMVNSMVR